MTFTYRRTPFIAIALVAFAFSVNAAHAASANSIHLSSNWSGYAATDDTYTAVSATWTVPKSRKTDNVISADATWVGIGGMTESDLVQAGTQALIINGRTRYMAWYELLPDAQRTAPIAVHAGDTVHVSVAEVSPDLWRITIANLTTGYTYDKNFTYDSSRSSAEWVVERPLAITENAEGYLPLSDFNEVDFKDATATTLGGSVQTVEGAESTALIMRDSGSRLLAVPETLDDDAFTVSYLTRSESTRYLKTLRRAYSLQQNVTSKKAHYEEINTRRIIDILHSAYSS